MMPAGAGLALTRDQCDRTRMSATRNDPVRTALASREDFARFLRGIMADNELTSKADLAELLDVEPATVSRWLAGVGEPSLDNLRRMTNLRMHLVDLMVEAGLISEAEAGRKPTPARPLPTEIRLVLELLNDELIPEHYKKILLQGVGHARRYFLDMFRAPREPGMARKAVRRGATKE